MKLYIVRHGQSTNNFLAEQTNYEEYMLKRDPDPPLTDLGFKQADRVAQYLCDKEPLQRANDSSRSPEMTGHGITQLYCSPMLRAMQTTHPISEALGLTPQIWVDIHEHGGIFERQGEGRSVGHPGRNRKGILDDFPDYQLSDEITDEGWWFGAEEDHAGCYGRAIRVAGTLHAMAQEMRQSGDEERVAIVTHGTFINALLQALLGSAPTFQFHFSHYNTSVTRVDFLEHGDHLAIRYTNRVEHLPPDMIS